ncbi:sugar ABC transporter substrate-binding protein [Mangrovactinospora gilvigrisea]|uniref:Sugar ABC transporter substrate-binding protein n=1 Tax=Mangrovactinospora gilvigrisea TaxID=1428644 RepID=A0A1J7B9J3_9ACTN|nr:extracellular solute-binding protein [Mangrovactinospora gilvigrisea]OIV35343.1 sugar ABC transporter substrate-binding protein [Mangrovactinospora gilvigrisea]
MSSNRTLRTRRAVLGTALTGAVALGASACIPGTGGTSTAAGTTGVAGVPDPKKAGKVTLTVWDGQTDGGGNTQLAELNKQFQAKYPNVAIKRVARSFADLKTTLKLAISANNPPDVVQVNQGYSDMVAFVKAGLLRPVDDYAGIYGWNSRYPQVLMDPNRVSVDAKHFGTGRLYGISQSSEYVGVYYNKRILKRLGIDVPRTWDEFTAALAKTKAAGTLPIEFGNLNKTMAIHVYGVILDHLAAAQSRDTVYNKAGGSYDTPETVEAARVLQDWVKKGWLSKDGNGQDQDAAYAGFAKGKSAFLVSGTWAMESLGSMGSNVGIVPPPPVKAGGASYSTGGPSTAMSITSRARHPEVAAAYLDFITNANASNVMTKNNVLPAIPGTAADAMPADSPNGQLVAGWKKLAADEGIVPYLDYSTPTFYDTITAQLQNLVAVKTTPQAFVDALQKDYASFLKQQQGSGS